REVRDSGRIEIQAACSAERITVRVQDNGAGIRPEALPKLFDPFYTTKRPGGGTGLGLSICMSIIREHGGQIEVERIPEGGSAFTIVFPVAPPQSAQMNDAIPKQSESQPRGAALGDAQSLKGRAILVVDDEQAILDLVKAGL